MEEGECTSFLMWLVHIMTRSACITSCCIIRHLTTAAYQSLQEAQIRGRRSSGCCSRSRAAASGRDGDLQIIMKLCHEWNGDPKLRLLTVVAQQLMQWPVQRRQLRLLFNSGN